MCGGGSNLPGVPLIPHMVNPICNRSPLHVHWWNLSTWGLTMDCTGERCVMIYNYYNDWISRLVHILIQHNMVILCRQDKYSIQYLYRDVRYDTFVVCGKAWQPLILDVFDVTVSVTESLFVHTWEHIGTSTGRFFRWKLGICQFIFSLLFIYLNHLVPLSLPYV